MVKVIDIDSLFDKYISDFVYKNIGKVKPEEIENQMPVLYEKFGDEKLKELDGTTPNTFYKQYSVKELLECLKSHIDGGVSVSDFLCEAITGKKEEGNELISELEKENGEEYTAYLMNIVSDMGLDIPTARYLEFALFDYPESVGELATEFLCPVADKVKDKVLSAYEKSPEDKKCRLVEILSGCSRDDRVFAVLTAEFIKHGENLPLYAQYLSKYGDERAIPFLTEAIKNEKITYADFEELRFAIESLGGEYNEKRDFTADKTYKKIKGEKRFGNKN